MTNHIKLIAYSLLSQKMANPCLIYSQLIAYLIIIFSIYTTIWKPIFNPWTNTNALPNPIGSPDNPNRLIYDPEAIKAASKDYGNIVQESPSAVLYPSSIEDIITLIKMSNNRSTPFGVSARGCGHSVRGQAMTRGGVVVEMGSLRSGIRVSWSPSLGYYADVGGDEMWIDVLWAGLEHGLAPVSWTDYLYLTVGGTLSNGGISGQSFLYGPQISNVLELDVITGTIEYCVCLLVLLLFFFFFR